MTFVEGSNGIIFIGVGLTGILLAMLSVLGRENLELFRFWEGISLRS